MKVIIFGLLTLIYFCVVCVGQKTIVDELLVNRQTSEFNITLDDQPWVKQALKTEKAVIFAPTNKAFKEFKKRFPNAQIDYKLGLGHIGKFDWAPSYINAKTATPSMDTNSLWITSAKNKDGKEEYFVNNAKILNMNNVKTWTVGVNNQQRLYIIDEVLVHTRVFGNAYSLMTDPEKYKFGKNFQSYVDSVTNNDRKDLYEGGNGNTYFIPDGDNKVNDLIIRGHIIPNKVLFTRTMRGVYKSDLYEKSSEIKVELSLVNISKVMDSGYQLKVKSNTMASTKNDIMGANLIREGVVLSDIISDRTNIAVSNGVVHFIKDPLMIINNNILEILEREKSGRLSEFMKFVEKAGLKNQFEDTSEKTLFAPNNEAFRMIPSEKLNEIMSGDEEKRKALIYLHMIKGSVTSYDVSSNSQDANIPSFDKERPLYFSVHGKDEKRTLTVEGGGVNATAVEADIGATNGIVHIINHVLGVPFRTIFDKFKTDAKLSVTFKFGQGSKWNDIFKDETRNFTLFVPNNKAWKKLQAEHPTTYKQLNLNGEFSDQIPKILDRHIILDQVLTKEDMQKLSKLDTKTATLEVVRYRSSSKESDLQLAWAEGRQKKAYIVRPDVKATNGIIHVIDTVFMERNDVASGSLTTTASIITTMISALIFKLVV